MTVSDVSACVISPHFLVGAGAPSSQSPFAQAIRGARNAGPQARSSLRRSRKQKRSDPRASGPRDPEASRIVGRDSAETGGVPRAMFEVCSTATPVGSQFFTHRFRRLGRLRSRPSSRLRAGEVPRTSPSARGRLPDVRESRGLDRRASGARKRPFAATAPTPLALERSSGAGAVVGASHPDGPAFVTLDRKRPFSGPGKSAYSPR
jgi:hypothetical protein